MSIEIIGREVLPNLYIKNIIIEEAKMHIVVAAFDYVDAEGKITWMVNDFINKPNVHMSLVVSSVPIESPIDAAVNSLILPDSQKTPFQLNDSNYNLYYSF